MTDVDECQICFELFNNTTHKEVSCLHCGKTVCRSCVAAHIKELHEEANCIFCSKVWSRNFLASVMTKKFMMKDYKEHRELIVWEQEQSTLPEAQDLAAATKRLDETNLEIIEIKARQIRSKKRLNILYNKRARDEFFLARAMSRPNQGTTDVGLLAQNRDSDVSEVDKFVTRGYCPRDGCNGFIGASWVCGVCEKKVCAQCMDAWDDDAHVCDEDTMASVREIRKDCKPCPKCRVRVFRVHGCAQMWCTNCHTAFSWTTLKILNTNHIHNPHYQEWLSRSGGQGASIDANHIICMAELDQNYLWARCRTMEVPHAETEKLSRFLQAIDHARYMATPRTQVGDPNWVPPDERIKAMNKLKIRYLLGKIDGEKFKVLVQRADKRLSFKREEAQILDTYYTVSRELITEFCMREQRLCDFYDRWREIYNFTKYSICNLCDEYGKKQNIINVPFLQPPSTMERTL